MQFFYLMFLFESRRYLPILQLYYNNNYYDIVIFSMGYRRVLTGIILAIAICTLQQPWVLSAV